MMPSNVWRARPALGQYIPLPISTKLIFLKLISTIRAAAIKNKKNRLDFDTSCGLSDTDYVNLIGISRADFDDVVSHVQSIRATKNRSIRTCIALLLVKLRTCLSNRMLSTLFNIESVVSEGQ